jgi:hypothetical protein
MTGSVRRSLAGGLAAVAFSLIAAGLTACSGSGGGGGGNNAPGDVVAEVGGSTVTRAAVSHWMATLAGGDYYELSGQRTVPAGLVSDPPDYPGCVASLEAAAAKSPTKGSRMTGAQLLTKCQEMYKALRTQAAGVLVKAQWTIGMDRELGVTVTDGEVLRFFKRIIVARYSNEAQALQSLARRREGVPDELLLLKLDLLSQKLQQKAGIEGKLAEAEKRWTAKTSCKPGYVVQHCKQYTGGSYSSQPPAALMEQVAKIATGRCINLAACEKQ